MRLWQFKELNRQKGYHWFSNDTIRFFSSRISNWDYCSGYFISSERQSFQHKRGYTIRKANFETGNVVTISELNEFSNIATAKRHLLKYLRGQA